MGLKHTIRDLGLRIAPGAMLELLSWRSQRLIIRQEREDGRLGASRAFAERYGPWVLTGPFTRMVYPETTLAERNLVSKLLGTYEAELHPWIERLIARRHSMSVNIGSADGYYTVGLALRKPDTPMIAFDTDRWARRATRTLANVNAADNVNVKGMCSPAWLAGNLNPGALLVSDCEGHEAALLDPLQAGTLRYADVLVELHDHVSPGVERLLRKRFGTSHDIERVASYEKIPEDYWQLSSMSPGLGRRLLSEGRNRTMHWLLMSCRERVFA